jgi:hypothetical protein
MGEKAFSAVLPARTMLRRTKKLAKQLAAPYTGRDGNGGP